jgi:hypothetical protein
MADYIVVHSVKVATKFTPETFGRLTTIGPRFLLTKKSGKRIQGKRCAYQVCQCNCSERNTTIVSRSNLTAGEVASCGCLHLEQSRLNGKKNKKHGMCESLTYRSWSGMRNRCNASNNQHYGGRGIRVCIRWQGAEGFINFLSDMGPRPSVNHSIDRYPNPDGNYEPGNCRWATLEEQQNNRRCTQFITLGKKTQSLMLWAKETGLNPHTIRWRLSQNWTALATLTTPTKNTGRKNKI